VIYKWPDVVFLIEADSFAYHQLWTMWSESAKCMRNAPHHDFRTVSWAEGAAGRIAVEVGKLRTVGKKSEELPVMCEVQFVELDGFWVVFYTSSSRAVDWDMVHAWVQEQAPSAGRCDAQNFCLCVNKIRELALLAEVHKS
jgi:hypothetical protein